MKKRILIFSTAYFPAIGGAEVAVKEITDRLPDFQFVMITPRYRSDLPKQEIIGNVEVHRLGIGRILDKFFLVLFGHKLAKKLGQFDAIWSIMASYAGFAALRHQQKNPSVPFLLTLQEGDSRAHIYRRVWWCWPYFKRIFKRADKIQAISNYLADWAKQLDAKCPVEVVPNGVDTANFTPRRQNDDDDIKKIITVSRLVKKNGLENLIRAIKLVNDDFGQPVVLKIIGDGKLKNKLKRLAHNLGLDDKFIIKDNKIDKIIFQNSVSNKQVYEYLGRADVFVRPSQSEGLGNAFLEAMAMGVPIIGTPVGGIPDFLIDGETGLFCKVTDPADIARQIKRILGDPVLAKKLAANARQLVVERYSWEGVAGQMRVIFNDLTA